MKVAQTELNEAEYQLLQHYAQTHCMTLKEALREAARLLVLADKANPDDPFFEKPPMVPASGRKERTSTERDEMLYREGH